MIRESIGDTTISSISGDSFPEALTLISMEPRSTMAMSRCSEPILSSKRRGNTQTIATTAIMKRANPASLFRILRFRTDEGIFRSMLVHVFEGLLLKRCAGIYSVLFVSDLSVLGVSVSGHGCPLVIFSTHVN